MKNKNVCGTPAVFDLDSPVAQHDLVLPKTSSISIFEDLAKHAGYYVKPRGFNLKEKHKSKFSSTNRTHDWYAYTRKPSGAGVGVGDKCSVKCDRYRYRI